jgi:hypothetical protein
VIILENAQETWVHINSVHKSSNNHIFFSCFKELRKNHARRYRIENYPCSNFVTASIPTYRKIDLVRRHHGARFEFFKNPSNIFEEISTCSKRRALQICNFLKKNTLYFGHRKKRQIWIFLGIWGPFKIALFMARSTIFSFLPRLE